METLYFMLGALSVVTLFAVVSVFRIKSELKEFAQAEAGRTHDLLGRSVDELENNLYRKIEELERELDKKEHELFNYSDSLDQNLRDEMEKLYGYVDSRTDKMADGVSKHIAEINQHLHDHDVRIGSSGQFDSKYASTK